MSGPLAHGLSSTKATLSLSFSEKKRKSFRSSRSFSLLSIQNITTYSAAACRSMPQRTARRGGGLQVPGGRPRPHGPCMLLHATARCCGEPQVGALPHAAAQGFDRRDSTNYRRTWLPKLEDQQHERLERNVRKRECYEFIFANDTGQSRPFLSKENAKVLPPAVPPHAAAFRCMQPHAAPGCQEVRGGGVLGPRLELTMQAKNGK